MPKKDMFTIKRGSALAKLMHRTKAIVIDEAPMMHKNYLEKIDNTLRDLMKNDTLFGGTLIFSIITFTFNFSFLFLFYFYLSLLRYSYYSSW